ncbi:MAG TPA: DUF3488 and transglutaminase-like domain-containing protein [Schlesneria sp.]
MNLEIVFKRSMYAVTALTGCLLGAAERGWIPYGTLPAVVIGYLWTESKPRQDRVKPRGMSDALAAICGLVALICSTSEFFSENIEGRLLSGTHLLVYLTWIVLVQQKTNRRYWQLLALGILQLAVASVLASGQETVWFGIGAIVYVFATLWTLSVFSIHRSASQFASKSTPPITERSTGPSMSGTSISMDSVQIEDGVTWITTPFMTGVAFNCAMSFFVSALFFILIPRVWIPGSSAFGSTGTGVRGVSKSAFASEIRLGDMGAILESLDPVMQVKLKTPLRASISAADYAERLGLAEPLFRGAVLSIYEAPRWKVEPLSIQQGSRLIPAERRSLVRQEIRLEDMSTDVLLAMGSPLGLVDPEEHPRGSYQALTGLIYRHPDFNKHGPVRYVVYSELPPPAVQLNAAQPVNEVLRQRYAQLGYIDRHRELPPRLERMAKLAQDVVQREEKRLRTRLGELEKARCIERFLRDSGEYSYTLNLSIDDKKIDPIEDFLFNRKQGHCEYFASALALMLRAVDIPTRLISGYKGGNYDQSTQTLHLQKRHAHAWCEAWIERRGWVTLDATPADERQAVVDAASGNRSVWTDMRSQLVGIWSENVVNISLDKQEEIIYRPVREVVRGLIKSLKELWESPKTSLASFFGSLTHPLGWFSLRGIGTLLVLVGMGWLAHRTWRRIAGWKGWSRVDTDRQSIRLVEFYERFARLMDSLSLHRAETQTQQEFANQTATTLQARLQSAGFTGSPLEISELFYKVRFGNESLPEREADHVEELLSGLERVLRPQT